VRLEGLGQLRNLLTSLGNEPDTLQLIAECLNQLRYGVTQYKGKPTLILTSDEKLQKTQIKINNEINKPTGKHVQSKLKRAHF
jgi:hypothetical protein